HRLDNFVDRTTPGAALAQRVPSHAARLAEKNPGRPAAGRSCAPARRPVAVPAPARLRPFRPPPRPPPPVLPGAVGRVRATPPTPPVEPCPATHTKAGPAAADHAPPQRRSPRPPCAPPPPASTPSDTPGASSSVPLPEKLSPIFRVSILECT